MFVDQSQQFSDITFIILMSSSILCFLRLTFVKDFQVIHMYIFFKLMISLHNYYKVYKCNKLNVSLWIQFLFSLL